jgi:DHA1 family inner membrane transport protein
MTFKVPLVSVKPHASDIILNGESIENPPQTGRMVLPTLFMSRFVTGIPGIISGLLLIEIGATFGSSVGITGQISTASSIIRVVAALIMGVLSVRYSYKSLLIAGLLLYLVAAAGSGFAVNFGMLILFFMLNGPAFAIVNPMTNTIVGEYFPKEKRTSIIGWLIAGATLSYVVGAQIIARIAGVGGWRCAFLGFFLPISIVGIVLTTLLIPKRETIQRNRSRRVSSEAFKSVLLHKSAVSCLLVTMFRMSVDMIISLYAVSFLRQQFLISRNFSSTVMTIIALSYTAGSLIAGRFVNMFGRKNVSSVTLVIGAAFVARAR